ncbi:MAG: hypothetical protein RL490_1493 [Pseudomonadota bacterium]
MRAGFLKTTIRLAATGAALLAMTPAMAQTMTPQDIAMGTSLSAADLQIMRAELRADKRKVTAETLALTEAEGAKFWPVYDRYIVELTVINNTKYALIKEYAENFGSYDDAQATKFISRWLDVDVKADALRKKYVPIVGKVLPGVKAATFFQIDRRLAMLINLGLASQLPILQLQGAK